MLLAGVLGAGMAGCATVSERSGAAAHEPAGDLRAEAERVFRLQNRVMQDLIFESELAGSDDLLAQAEYRLASDCRPLNESAAMHAGGQEPPLALKLSVLDAMGDCESAASDAERLLNGGGDPELATTGER